MPHNLEDSINNNILKEYSNKIIEDSTIISFSTLIYIIEWLSSLWESMWLTQFVDISGSGKPSSSREHAHCVVETKRKTEDDGKMLPKYNSDATKVTSKGLGLNKAFTGRTAQFQVDTAQAGRWNESTLCTP